MSLFTSSNSRPRSLMEALLAKKIEAASQQTGPGGSRLIRTDSMDSTSSIGSHGSLILGDDVCRCDDCLLGIVDRYTIGPKETASGIKKVGENVLATGSEVVVIDLRQNDAFAKSCYFCSSSTNIVGKLCQSVILA
uniref:Uncharacterized protein n=1 Tax=Anopheles coluzzii TaxID=1518534 RepID=A0A8W7Q2M5_ANOCL